MTKLDGGRVVLSEVGGRDPKVPAAAAWLEDVRMRPYIAGDEERLRRMSDRLSKHSMHARFFTGTPRIPEMYVRSLRNLDHWDHEAMVALLDGEVLGIAEYVRNRRAPSRAELAAMVADSWQRHGLARYLTVFLGQMAWRRGIVAFEAEVMLGNRPAIMAIRDAWPAARARRADGAARYELPIPPLLARHQPWPWPRPPGTPDARPAHVLPAGGWPAPAHL